MQTFDRLVAMIAEKNTLPTPLTQEEVEFTNLQVIVPDRDHLNNTVLRIQAAPTAKHYAGQKDLTYIRPDLITLGTLEFYQEDPFTYAQVLSLIEQQKNAPITPADFTNTDIPAMPDTGVIVAFTLTSQATSLAWTGYTQVSLLTGIPASAASFNNFMYNQAAALFAA